MRHKLDDGISGIQQGSYDKKLQACIATRVYEQRGPAYYLALLTSSPPIIVGPPVPPDLIFCPPSSFHHFFVTPFHAGIVDSPCTLSWICCPELSPIRGLSLLFLRKIDMIPINKYCTVCLEWMEVRFLCTA